LGVEDEVIGHESIYHGLVVKEGNEEAGGVLESNGLEHEEEQFTETSDK